MPEAYDLHEGRLIQEAYAGSAVAGLNAVTTPVPNGKVHTIITASYYPDLEETKTVQFLKQTRAGGTHALTVPQSIKLSQTLKFPLLEQGNELKLFPGEILKVTRDSATAGSVMYLEYTFIESDLPYYAYEEPLKKVVKTSGRHGSTWASSGGLSTGGSGSGGDNPTEGGGNKGEPQPR